ncbi:acyl-CoA carboxylase subunit epsilon [Streptomyces sp. NPDC002851]
MTDTDGHAALLRVERGSASDEELAAITVTLMSLLAEREPREQDEGARPAATGWRGRHRSTEYRPPRSWR